jgi:hypothetical protein
MLGDDFKDEKKVKLSKVIPGEKLKFTYESDFGDSWNHNIGLLRRSGERGRRATV